MTVPTYFRVSNQDIPSTAEVPSLFRDAWVLDAKSVVVIDMNKAKEIKKAELRRERTERFAKMDAEYMMALEQSNTSKKKKIAEDKQKLRDFSEHEVFNTVETPEELDQLTLDYFLS